MRRWGAAVLVLAASCMAAPQSAPGPGPTPAPTSAAPSPAATVAEPAFEEFDVPAGAHPHDVAPDPGDGVVWYTAQNQGALGRLDPETGRTRHIPLGSGSRPHGVIVGPDGAPWITDSGLNAIVRVDPETDAVRRFPLRGPDANLNTAAFDRAGTLWFTGQAGYYGSVEPRSGEVRVRRAARGRGPYGIATAPDGRVWYSSLAGSYVARIDPETGRTRREDVPTPDGGARRIWSDSKGTLWVTEWFAGKLGRFDPRADEWREYDLPGSNPMPYAVYVDEHDTVWVTDFGANALVAFDPQTERFRSFRFPSAGADVRQLLGRPGEIWGAESGTDKLVVLRTA